MTDQLGRECGAALLFYVLSSLFQTSLTSQIPLPRTKEAIEFQDGLFLVFYERYNWFQGVNLSRMS